MTSAANDRAPLADGVRTLSHGFPRAYPYIQARIVRRATTGATGDGASRPRMMAGRLVGDRNG